MPPIQWRNIPAEQWSTCLCWADTLAWCSLKQETTQKLSASKAVCSSVKQKKEIFCRMFKLLYSTQWKLMLTLSSSKKAPQIRPFNSFLFFWSHLIGWYISRYMEEQLDYSANSLFLGSSQQRKFWTNG